ncbi:MAG: chromosomal replication initiator protein DnaA [Chloroflexota bacterium]
MELRSAQTIWETALGELQIQVSRPNYRTWLEKTIGLSCQESEFIIGVPNTFVAEYLRKNQYSIIEKTLINIMHRNIRASFKVYSGRKSQRETNTSHGEIIPATASSALRLHPSYTFASFVVGNCNRLACAASQEVAHHPGHSYNPLFIYGGVGLGKTHLLQAIGHTGLAGNCQVLYVSGEEFTNEFVTAVRDRKMADFRSRYRSTDVLLMDDIQFIGGKEQTEECFFHTFNELHNSGRQIVITCDKTPEEIPKFSARLRSRFEWGLVVDIKKPDIETRRAILKAKAERDGADINPATLDFIAEHVQENIRTLEGSLNRVVAYAKLLNTMLTPEIAAAALTDIASKAEKAVKPDRFIPSRVIEAVAHSFQLSPEDLTGRKRDRETALAREVAVYMLRKGNSFSLAEIGRELGGRNPSTVSHAYHKIEGFLESSPYLKQKLQDIHEVLSLKN